MKMCLAYLNGEPGSNKAISTMAAINEAMPPKAAPAVPLPKPRPGAAPAPVHHWWSWIFE
jgi:hypothetical protein